MAQSSGAALTLLHVWDVPSYAYGGMELCAADLLAPLQGQAQLKLDAALADVQKMLPRAVAVLRCGQASSEIEGAIGDLGPDLVVMGTRGRRGVARAFLGSVAEKVVRTSNVAVLTVHAKAEAQHAPLAPLAPHAPA